MQNTVYFCPQYNIQYTCLSPSQLDCIEEKKYALREIKTNIYWIKKEGLSIGGDEAKGRKQLFERNSILEAAARIGKVS